MALVFSFFPGFEKVKINLRRHLEVVVINAKTVFVEANISRDLVFPVLKNLFCRILLRAVKTEMVLSTSS